MSLLLASGGGAVTHDATGALVGSGSAVNGTANRTRAHATTGALTGQGSAVAGSAARTRAHDAVGVLAGAGAIVVGSARLNRPHAASGVLVADGAVVAGTANHISLYPDPSDVRAGVQYGPGGIYVGTLESTAGEMNISLRSFGGRF
jgi:hypothetical protein